MRAIAKQSHFSCLSEIEIATPAFGGLAMTARLIVIARSEATKQSRIYLQRRNEIATASLQEASHLWV